MFSMPPATTHSASPARIACAASATVFSPLPQTLLIVVDGTLSASPAPIADCRAVFCPRPAWSTLPMSTSSTASMPARRSASSTAIDPSRVAGTSVNTPPKVPTGVRTALTMTASSMPLTLRPALRLHLQADAERAAYRARNEAASKRCRCGPCCSTTYAAASDPIRPATSGDAPDLKPADHPGDIRIACAGRVDSLAAPARRGSPRRHPASAARFPPTRGSRQPCATRAGRSMERPVRSRIISNS